MPSLSKKMIDQEKRSRSLNDPSTPLSFRANTTWPRASMCNVKFALRCANQCGFCLSTCQCDDEQAGMQAAAGDRLSSDNRPHGWCTVFC